jgi:hypothetical protein
MRGRLATQCGYSQEYIDAMELLDVQKMSAFWTIEPPVESMYLAVHFKREEKKGGGMNVIPNTGGSRPWAQQPEHIKQAIIGQYMDANPGKTAEDFEKDRVAQQQARYKSRLEEARKKKAMTL